MSGKKKADAPAPMRDPRNYTRGNSNSARGLLRGLDPYAIGRASAVAMERRTQNEKEAS